MALGNSTFFKTEDESSSVVIVSNVAEWVTGIDAGGMDDTDNSGSLVTDPDSQVTASTRKTIWRTGIKGTQLRIRMAYDDGDTPSTDPVVNVFGRTNGGKWERLVNNNRSASITLTTDSGNDVVDEGMKHTNPHWDDHSVDCDACDEVLFAVETAYAVSSGDASKAKLEVKIV